MDGIVDVDNYDEFIAYAKGNQSDVKKLLDVKSDIMVMPEISIDPKEKGIKKLMNPVKGIQAVIVNAPVRGLNAVNRLANNRKIEEQEYTCLILAFYMSGLSQVLVLSEE